MEDCNCHQSLRLKKENEELNKMSNEIPNPYDDPRRHVEDIAEEYQHDIDKLEKENEELKKENAELEKQFENSCFMQVEINGLRRNNEELKKEVLHVREVSRLQHDRMHKENEELKEKVEQLEDKLEAFSQEGDK